MTRSLLFLLILTLIDKSGQAQIGNAQAIGVINLGRDSLFVPAIGKAKTPNCAIAGTCNGPCAIFTFIGAGSWNIEGNWEGGVMPPSVLGGCDQIVINPVGNEECLLNIPLQIIPSGTSITVIAGKKLRIPGRLLYH